VVESRPVLVPPTGVFGALVVVVVGLFAGFVVGVDPGAVVAVVAVEPVVAVVEACADDGAGDEACAVDGVGFVGCGFGFFDVGV
jgi:hypothetical protein